MLCWNFNRMQFWRLPNTNFIDQTSSPFIINKNAYIFQLNRHITMQILYKVLQNNQLGKIGWEPAVDTGSPALSVNTRPVQHAWGIKGGGWPSRPPHIWRSPRDSRSLWNFSVPPDFPRDGQGPVGHRGRCPFFFFLVERGTWGGGKIRLGGPEGDRGPEFCFN